MKQYIHYKQYYHHTLDYLPLNGIKSAKQVVAKKLTGLGEINMKLVVEENKKDKLSLTDQRWEKARIQVRPKSIAALKKLVGTPKGSRVFRIEKDNDLSIVAKPSDLKKMVNLFDPRQSLKGFFSPSVTAQLLERLPDKGGLPKVIRFDKRERIYKDRQRRIFEVGRVVGVMDIPMPDWLQKLEVFFDMLRFDSIVVERNATLEIDANLSVLDIFDLDLHEGARILQRTNRLRMNVHGSIRTHS